MDGISDKQSEQPAKGKQLIIRIYLAITVCVLGSAVGLGYAWFSARRITQEHSKVCCAAMEIRIEAAAAHLWLEKYLFRPDDNYLNRIRSHLDNAVWYSEAILHGGTNQHDSYPHVRNASIRQYAETISKQIASYREQILDRLEFVTLSSQGAYAVAAFDADFISLVSLAEQMEKDIKHMQQRELYVFYGACGMLLFCWLMLGGIFILYLRQNFRKQRMHKQQVEIANSKLEASNAELVETQAKLNRINEKLKRAVREAKRLARLSDKTNKLKTDFLANISHELRTPMNAVLGFSDLLREEPLAEHQKEFVQSIHAAAGTMLCLIDGILDLTEIERGDIVLSPQPLSLEKLLRELWSIYYLPAEDKGLCFEIQRIGQLPEHILADPVHLRQCLVCLIDNALKYTEKGHIYVRISRKDDAIRSWLRFEVEDTGIGIPQEEQDWIWNIFSRSDNKINRDNRGFGLSLPITVQL
ncbi:MAG: histidine kinase dimerization/phospho-acceptor domain-containing protein, partial [Anaerohalosphaeraceae bacterium]